MADRVIENVYIEIELDLSPKEWKKITEAIKKLKLLMKSMGKDIDKVFSNAGGALRTVSKSITAIKSNSKQLTSTLNQVNKTAERSVGTFGRIFKSVRKLNTELGDTEHKSKKFVEFAKRAGAALAGIGTGKKGVEIFANYEQQLKRIKQITNASDLDFNKLETVVSALGKKTQYSSTEVAVAGKILARSGFHIKEVMDTLPAVLDLGIATEHGLAESASAVTEAMKAFNYETKDATKLVDMFTAATNGANITMSSLGLDLVNVQTSAANLGVSLEDTLSLIALLGDLGLKDGNAGTALNSFFTTLKQKADQAGAIKIGNVKLNLKADDGSLRDINEIFKDINKILEPLDTLSASSVLTEVFNVRGDKAAGSLVKILQKNENAISDFRGYLKNSNGIAREFASEIEELTSGSLARIQASMESIFKSIGSIMKPVVIVLDKFLQLVALIADTLVGKVLLALGFTTLGFIAMAGAGAKMFNMLKDGWGAATDLIPTLKKLGGVIKWNAIWSKVLTLEFWLIVGAVIALGLAWRDLWRFFKGEDSYIGAFVEKFKAWYDTLGYFQKLFWDWVTLTPRIFWVIVKSIFKGVEWLVNKVSALFGKDITKNVTVAVNSDALDSVNLDDANKTVQTATKKIDGSHRDGLANVPWDNYIARLHKGERVLTAEENEEYSEGNSVSRIVIKESSGKKVEKHYHKTVTIAPGAIVMQISGLTKEEVKDVAKETLNDVINTDGTEMGVDIDE